MMERKSRMQDLVCVYDILEVKRWPSVDKWSS